MVSHVALTVPLLLQYPGALLHGTESRSAAEEISFHDGTPRCISAVTKPFIEPDNTIREMRVCVPVRLPPNSYRNVIRLH